MKTLRSIAALMFFAALVVVPAFAQNGSTTAAASQPNVKIAIIDTGAFGDEKAGITKYTQAFKTLQTQMQPRLTEIQTMETRLKTIQTEFENLAKQAGQPNSPVSQEALQKKREEGEKLQLEYNYKVEDYKAALTRSQQSVLGPVQNDIGKAMQEYAKKNGYTMVLDISKDQAGLLLWADAASINATTADFIKFYNTRPAGTAAATTPR